MSAWTREHAILRLQEIGARYGRTPKLDDIMPHHMVMVRLFGSIAEAQKAAGFVPRRQGRPRDGDRACRVAR
jgi:hypothetical protein